MHAFRTAALSSCLRTPRQRGVAALLAVFGGMALAVTRSSTVTGLDGSISTAVHHGVTAPAVALSEAISRLAATQTALGLTLVAAALLVATRHWRSAVALGVSFVLAQVAVQAIKVLIERPRPEQAVDHASGFSFPSAHSATAMAIYATLAVIGMRRTRGPVRIAIGLAAGLVILAVGVTRVYLGAHYPTDVLAGWMAGAVVVLASWSLVGRLPMPGAAPRPA